MKDLRTMRSGILGRECEYYGSIILLYLLHCFVNFDFLKFIGH
jgi:hypothetical protein